MLLWFSMNVDGLSIGSTLYPVLGNMKLHQSSFHTLFITWTAQPKSKYKKHSLVFHPGIKFPKKRFHKHMSHDIWPFSTSLSCYPSVDISHKEWCSECTPSFFRQKIMWYLCHSFPFPSSFWGSYLNFPTTIRCASISLYDSLKYALDPSRTMHFDLV